MAACTAVQLPDTANTKLPDTLADAEEFGRDQLFFRDVIHQI
jgi:hypothetical protein